MPTRMKISEFLSMETHEWDLGHLKHALQNAIELEHSTLPLYMFAMYSIKIQNYTAYNLIRSIVMEEMIHMALAANMLSAIGGVPQIEGLHPAYPSQGLPGGAEPDVHARLAPLSNRQVRNFMRVEVPDFLISNFLTADQVAHEEYPTIGRFYEAVRAAFLHLEAEGGQISAAIAKGGSSNQIEENIGSEKVEDFDGILLALDLITEQGEGSTSTTLLADERFDGEESHYTRFAGIYYGKKFVNPELHHVTPETEQSFFRGDKVMSPTVINALAVPADGYAKILDEYARLDPEAAIRARHALDAVDQAYTDVMTNLDAAWNGPANEHGERMGAAVTAMSQLKVPIRISSAYYPNYPVEDEDEAIWQPALMSLEIPESIIADLPGLYPDEWDDLNLYTDLTQPVYFGPRFLNLNVTEVPAV
ncbi:MAG: ferritin-like protein [Chloroflexi bacterium]|nr:ferritin-like protein [Chloroflexota bacterium]